MKQGAAILEITTETKSRRKRVVVLPVVRPRIQPRRIPQSILARLKHLEMEIAFAQNNRDKLWREVRDALADGAAVEPGPHRAWFKFVIRTTKSGKRIVSQRMEVR